MASARDHRRCALVALYQLDAAGADAAPTTEALDAALEAWSDDDEGTPLCADAAARRKGIALAEAAWAARAEADAAIAPLTPEWPTHRQPAVDRNILRLAHHELRLGAAPPKVVLDEAVELAREFSTERSPAFVNGVLDRVYHQLHDEATPALRCPAPPPASLDDEESEA